MADPDIGGEIGRVREGPLTTGSGILDNCTGIVDAWHRSSSSAVEALLVLGLVLNGANRHFCPCRTGPLIRLAIEVRCTVHDDVDVVAMTNLLLTLKLLSHYRGGGQCVIIGAWNVGALVQSTCRLSDQRNEAIQMWVRNPCVCCGTTI